MVLVLPYKAISSSDEALEWILQAIVIVIIYQKVWTLYFELSGRTNADSVPTPIRGSKAIKNLTLLNPPTPLPGRASEGGGQARILSGPEGPGSNPGQPRKQSSSASA